MTATAQRRCERVRVERARRAYAATLATLDLRHAVEALAAEEAALIPAPSCRCGPRAFGHAGHCVKCGRDTA